MTIIQSIRILVFILFMTASMVQAAICDSMDTKPGVVCDGGCVFAGVWQGKRYMTTPGNCKDSSSPVCDGGADTLTKVWGASGVIAGTKDLDDGQKNTIKLVSNFSNTMAARYCDLLSFGGFSDWYLPAENEMLLLRKNANAIGGFNYQNISWYWTSTETSWPQNPEYEKPIARVVGMGYTAASNLYKTDAYGVRCVRSY